MFRPPNANHPPNDGRSQPYNQNGHPSNPQFGAQFHPSGYQPHSQSGAQFYPSGHQPHPQSGAQFYPSGHQPHPQFSAQFWPEGAATYWTPSNQQPTMVQTRVSKVSFFEGATEIDQEHPIFVNIGGNCDSTGRQDSNENATQTPIFSTSNQHATAALNVDVEYFKNARKYRSRHPSHVTVQGDYNGKIKDLIAEGSRSENTIPTAHAQSNQQAQKPSYVAHQQVYVSQQAPPPVPPRRSQPTHHFSAHSSVQSSAVESQGHGTPLTTISVQSSQYSFTSNVVEGHTGGAHTQARAGASNMVDSRYPEFLPKESSESKKSHPRRPRLVVEEDSEGTYSCSQTPQLDN